MKHYKHLFIAIFAATVIGTPWLMSTYPGSTQFIDSLFGYIGRNIGAVFFQESITVAQLQDKYEAIEENKKNNEKIKILIVPGHEPDFGGTEFGILKERDMVIDMSEELAKFFRNNSHYEVVMARDKNGWNPELKKYWADHWDEITAFIKTNKEEMFRLVNDGRVSKITDGVIHNNAPQNVAIRLYGINKWANENGIDMIVHVHFNDYPRRNTVTAGEYSGFSIYVPEEQYSNGKTTKAIADTVFKRLAKYNAVSDLPKEDAGVVEEQELIAIGSYNTLDAPSMLIEYGYIYEPQFREPAVRSTIFKDLSFQTYLGVQDFFGSGNDVSFTFDTLMLPYDWQNNISEGTTDRSAVLALQTALMLDGAYPPLGKSKNDCPRTGKFGPCTMTALNNFQNRYSIIGERNVVGEQTRKVLREKFFHNISI